MSQMKLVMALLFAGALGFGGALWLTSIGIGGLTLSMPSVKASGAPAEKKAAEATPVQVGSAVTRDVTDYEDFTGRTEAFKAVDVRARVTGYLDKLRFKDGDDVYAGSILFEIDPRPYEIEVDRTEGNLEQARAHLKRLDADLDRAQKLFAKGAIGREEFDRFAGDHAEAEASVNIAESNRDMARLNLEYTKVTSPINGRISRRLIDPGNLVKADETPLTTIVALDPMYVSFDIDERTMLRISRLIEEGTIKKGAEGGVEVMFGLADEEGFPNKGKIEFKDNRVDPATGTLRLRGIFPNPKKVLTPGLFLRVRVPVGEAHKALMVNESALWKDQGQNSVYVVEAREKKNQETGKVDKVNVVASRKVKLGAVHDGLCVVEQGITPADRIVLDSLQFVRNGTEVKPKAVDMVTLKPPVELSNGKTGPPPEKARAAD